MTQPQKTTPPWDPIAGRHLLRRAAPVTYEGWFGNPEDRRDFTGVDEVLTEASASPRPETGMRVGGGGRRHRKFLNPGA